ncbi:tight adherence pilus pseudopilin TadF [Vibrio nomapromontoriensis]|uniref:tight adherence pilus pseudopilin TadF n=1 Tax=Vibrio nomapromontoriensis TaxID=2910246 RepID=UPI003D116F85
MVSQFSPQKLNRNKGSFTIELAFVLIAILIVVLFTASLANIIFKQSLLDRTSYSLVNIINDRTRFYNVNGSTRYDINTADAEDIYKLAHRLIFSHSGATNSSDLHLSLESLNDGKHQSVSIGSGDGCSGVPALIYQSHLIPIDNDGNKHPIYKVSLCYSTQVWFSGFGSWSNKFSWLTSESVIVGR